LVIIATNGNAILVSGDNRVISEDACYQSVQNSVPFRLPSKNVNIKISASLSVLYYSHLKEEN
jgi:hypothetical protein